MVGGTGQCARLRVRLRTMHWKSLIAVAVVSGAVVGASPSPARAATLDRSASKKAEGDVSKEDVRRAIAIFRRDPLNAQGEMTRPIILKFAEDSPDVEIALDDKHMPWFKSKSLPEETGAVLLVAFVAGDIESQLDSGKTKDDPVAATEQVIATYRQLQKADPKLKVREIEDLIDLQKHGKLAEHFKEG